MDIEVYYLLGAIRKALGFYSDKELIEWLDFFLRYSRAWKEYRAAGIKTPLNR